MKWVPGVLLLAMIIGVWYVSRAPAHPTRVVMAEIVALADVPGRAGLRHITVRFEDGSERRIETLAPYFFKPGYQAKIGIYERPLFDARYDIIGDWTIDPQS